MISYTVTMRMRGTRDGRKVATRRTHVYAIDHEDAITKAKEIVVNATEFSIKAGSRD